MKREYPNPIPEIHPVPEYLASGRRLEWYSDVKEALQVPWMGVVTMAYTHYEHFFSEFWSKARLLLCSRPFVESCANLRAFVETAVNGLDVQKMAGPLAAAGYSPREIAQIRHVIEIFSRGNFLYLMQATLVRALLEGWEMKGAAPCAPFPGRHGPEADAALVLMESHHADPETLARYGDIKETLGLPFVNTDYRALGRWPSYLAVAWSSLKRMVRTPEYPRLCECVHEIAFEVVSEQLPNPGRLDPTMLRQAAARDGDPTEVLQVARLFQWLLPGLVVNVAFLRACLAPESEA